MSALVINFWICLICCCTCTPIIFGYQLAIYSFIAPLAIICWQQWKTWFVCIFSVSFGLIILNLIREKIGLSIPMEKSIQIFCLSVVAFAPFKKLFWQNKFFGVFIIYTIIRIMLDVFFMNIWETNHLQMLLAPFILCLVCWNTASFSKAVNKNTLFRIVITIFFAVILYHLSVAILNDEISDSLLKIKTMAVLCNMLVFPILYWRYSYVLVAIMIPFNMILGVRTGLFALIVSLSVFWSIKRAPRFTGKMLVFAISALAVIALFSFDILYENKIAVALGQKYGSFYERIMLWSRINTLCLNDFWFGVGPNTLADFLRKPFSYVYKGKEILNTVRHPHNIFLELKTSLGTIGYFFAFGACIQWIIKSFKRNLSSLQITCVVYAFIVMGAYTSFFRDAWLLAWVGFLIMLSKSLADNSDIPLTDDFPKFTKLKFFSETR